jgi:hypothetical protein
LVNTEDAAAIPYLQNAVANENDEGVRNTLRTELEALQKKLGTVQPTEAEKASR